MICLGLDKLFDVDAMGVKSHFEHVADHRCDKHPICIAANQDKTEDVHSFTKASNITDHVEKRVDDALVLNNPVRQAEIRLEVGCRIDSAKGVMSGVVNGQELKHFRLITFPYLEIRILQLHLV